MRNARNEVKESRKELRGDHQELRKDRAELRRDIRNGAGKEEIRKDRQEIRDDFKEIPKTERNSGKTRHDWTQLTASSKQTCARDSSSDSIRLTAQVSGGRALPFTVPARRESPLTTLTVKVTIQGL